MIYEDRGCTFAVVFSSVVAEDLWGEEEEELNFKRLLLLTLTLCPRHAKFCVHACMTPEFSGRTKLLYFALAKWAFAVSDFYATSCCAARSGGRNQISASRNRKFACSLNANIAQARAQTLRAKPFPLGSPCDCRATSCIKRDQIGAFCAVLQVLSPRAAGVESKNSCHKLSPSFLTRARKI